MSSLETLLEAARYLEYRADAKARGEEPKDYHSFASSSPPDSVSRSSSPPPSLTRSPSSTNLVRHLSNATKQTFVINPNPSTGGILTSPNYYPSSYHHNHPSPSPSPPTSSSHVVKSAEEVKYAAAYALDGLSTSRPGPYHPHNHQTTSNNNGIGIRHVTGHHMILEDNHDSVSLMQEARRKAGAGTREVHNKLEKNRRAHLKECFDLLKKQLPSLEDKKTSNLAVLRSALKFIQVLKRKDREMEQELEQLARAKISLQQRLSTLRRDIPQWDTMEQASNFLPSLLGAGSSSSCHSTSSQRDLNDTELTSGYSSTRHPRISGGSGRDQDSNSTATADEMGNVSDFDDEGSLSHRPLSATPPLKVVLRSPSPVQLSELKKEPLSPSSAHSSDIQKKEPSSPSLVQKERASPLAIKKESLLPLDMKKDAMLTLSRPIGSASSSPGATTNRYSPLQPKSSSSLPNLLCEEPSWPSYKLPGIRSPMHDHHRGNLKCRPRSPLCSPPPKQPRLDCDDITIHHPRSTIKGLFAPMPAHLQIPQQVISGGPTLVSSPVQVLASPHSRIHMINPASPGSQPLALTVHTPIVTPIVSGVTIPSSTRSFTTTTSSVPAVSPATTIHVSSKTNTNSLTYFSEMPPLLITGLGEHGNAFVVGKPDLITKNGKGNNKMLPTTTGMIGRVGTTPVTFPMGLTVPNGLISATPISFTTKSNHPGSHEPQMTIVTTGCSIPPSTIVTSRSTTCTPTIGIPAFTAHLTTAGITHVVSPISGNLNTTLTPVVAPMAMMSQATNHHLAHILTTPQGGKVMTPLMKPVGQLPIVNAQYLSLPPQQLVKPMVVVSTPSTLQHGNVSNVNMKPDPGSQ